MKKMVPRKKIFFAVLFIILFAAGIIFYISNNTKESFSVKTFLLKLNIPLGGEAISKINIINNEETTKEFSISLSGLNGLASLSEKKLLLPPHGSREISIFFKDSISNVGVYSSELVISNEIAEKKIPVIVVLEDSKSVFSIISTGLPQYSDIYPGGKLGIETKVYDLDAVEIFSVKGKQQIQNTRGEVLWSDEGDLVVDGSKVSIVDIPENWEEGDYIFITSIDYKETKSISGYFFSLSEKGNTFLQDSSAKLLILIVLIFIFGFIILFFYLIKSRDEFLIKLKEQQNEELGRNLKLIDLSRQRIEESSKQTPVEKEKKIFKLKKAKKRIIKIIKKKQAVQRRDLKKLKKQKKKNELKETLNSWKKQGYKMFETEKEIKKVGSTRKQIANWKKQGYKI